MSTASPPMFGSPVIWQVIPRATPGRTVADHVPLVIEEHHVEVALGTDRERRTLPRFQSRVGRGRQVRLIPLEAEDREPGLRVRLQEDRLEDLRRLCRAEVVETPYHGLAAAVLFTP